MAYGAESMAGSYAAGEQTVRLRFTGGALPMLGRVLLSAICVLLIVPAAWGVIPFVRWFVEHLEWSDGSQARFEGQPGDVWYLFSLIGVISYLPIAAQWVLGDAFYVSLGASILTALLTASLAVPLWRWYMQNARIGQTDDLTFDGDVPTYAGFTIGIQLAAYTIVGWAWVATAMQRWLMSHIRSSEVRFEFVGSGLNLLWRVIVVALASVLIIPIPWVMRWMTAWFVEQTVMHRTGVAPQPPIA